MNTQSSSNPKLAAGDRIRVEQNIVGGGGDWKTKVEGVVESIGPESTGSWFKHGKNDRYWLHRIRLRKDDGEVTTLTIDSHSRIDLIERKK